MFFSTGLKVSWLGGLSLPQRFPFGDPACAKEHRSSLKAGMPAKPWISRQILCRTSVHTCLTEVLQERREPFFLRSTFSVRQGAHVEDYLGIITIRSRDKVHAGTEKGFVPRRADFGVRGREVERRTIGPWWRRRCCSWWQSGVGRAAPGIGHVAGEERWQRHATHSRSNSSV